MSGTRPVLAILAAIAVASAGCATASLGSNQTLHIGSSPEGAQCALTRGGQSVGALVTPGSLEVTRSRQPISIVCTKEGYEEARAVLNSETSPGLSGGPGLIGGLIAIGTIVDMSTGADTRYRAVTVKLLPLSSADATVTAAAPTPVPPVSASAASAVLTGPPPSPGSTPVPPPATGTGNAVMTGPPAPSGAQEAATYASNSEQPAERAPIQVRKSRSASPTSSSVAAGTPVGPGNWVCAIENIGNNTNPRYTLQFVIGSDNSIKVTTYGDAPATIVQSQPLTFTALNPRGSRQIKFTWRPDNSMIVTGPNTGDPNRYFYNEGSCTKAS